MPKIVANGVETWYEESGSGVAALFIHGGFGVPQTTLVATPGVDAIEQAVPLVRGQIRGEVPSLERGDRRHPLRATRDDVPHRHLPGVLKLDGGPRAVRVYPARELSQAGQERVARNSDLVRVARAHRPRDRGNAHRDHPGAAARALLVVAVDALAEAAVGLAQVRAHRRQDDAIAKLEAADAARR